MGLDAMFKANKQGKQEPTSSNMDDGVYRSRAEEETANATANSRTNSRTNSSSNSNDGGDSSRKTTKRSTKNSVNDDPLLPEKKRARRRLIGALALVMAAVIGLPMIFDSEPKTNINKIAIEIPSKDQALDSSTTAPIAPTAPKSDVVADKSAEVKSKDRTILTAQQSLDSTEEIVQTVPAQSQTPVPANKPVATTPAETKVTAKPEKVAEKTPDRKPEAKPTPAPSTAPSTTTATEVASAKPNNKNEAARALALLEGRSVPAVEKKAEKKAEPTANVATTVAAPAGSFAVQVAAFSTPEKIRDLQNQLKASNIASYTQKIITKNGDVTRIRVGPFANKEEAEKMRAKLVKLGLNGSLIPQ